MFVYIFAWRLHGFKILCYTSAQLVCGLKTLGSLLKPVVIINQRFQPNCDELIAVFPNKKLKRYGSAMVTFQSRSWKLYCRVGSSSPAKSNFLFYFPSTYMY